MGSGVPRPELGDVNVQMGRESLLYKLTAVHRAGGRGVGNWGLNECFSRTQPSVRIFGGEQKWSSVMEGVSLSLSLQWLP